eukprot:scaffold242126_cov20-Tisochrysis_lutea.AAC.2
MPYFVTTGYEDESIKLVEEIMLDRDIPDPQGNVDSSSSWKNRSKRVASPSGAQHQLVNQVDTDDRPCFGVHCLNDSICWQGRSSKTFCPEVHIATARQHQLILWKSLAGMILRVDIDQA